MVNQDNVSPENYPIIESLIKQKITVCPHCKKAVDPKYSTEDRVKVMVGIPTMGNLEARAFDHFIDWAMYLKELEWKAPVKFFFSSVGNVLTPWARERIAEIAVKKGFDYVLFVDDDMLFPFDIFERLYKHNVDVVVPLMFMRLGAHKPVIYEVKQGYDRTVHKEYYKTYIIEDYPKDTLFKVDATGMGICLVKVDVLKKLEPPWFMNTMGTGEDVYFTEKASRAGFGVYVDTTFHNIVHLGERKWVTEEEYLKAKKERAKI